MAETTNILWCHSTFNAWIGCTRVSEGCDFCYAEAQNHVHKWNGGEWGPGAPRKVMADAYWTKPLQWEKRAMLLGKRHLVFCSSLADVFDDEAPEGQRDRLWTLIRCTPHLTWLLLTKRPLNIPKMLPPDWGPNGYPNVWLGATAETQKWADLRTYALSRVPAKVKFLSIEPQIERIELGSRLYKRNADRREIDWVICGGESGAKSKVRPFNVGWALGLVKECQAAGVPIFVKQLGRRPQITRPGLFGRGLITDHLVFDDDKGGHWDEWHFEPESSLLKVRQWPAEVCP